MASRRDKELDHQFRMRLVQAISLGWQGLMRLGCVVIFCVCAYYCLREIARRQTLADIRFSAFADLRANRWFSLVLPWCLTGATSAVAVGQAWLRKRHIKRISSESSEMQKLIDPGRRSSQLSKKGETSPEDF
jgi:hypothetical protein